VNQGNLIGVERRSGEGTSDFQQIGINSNMTTWITGSIIFTGSIPAPQPNDPGRAGVIQEAFQGLMNNDAWLSLTISNTGTALGMSVATLSSSLSARAARLEDNSGVGINEHVHVIPLGAPTLNLSDKWEYSVNEYYVQTNTTGSGGRLRFPITIPVSSSIKSLHATVIGSGHGALPANLPTLKLQTKTIRLGTVNSQTSATTTGTDPSADLTSYQRWHEIVATPAAPVTGSATSTIWAELSGEFGANARDEGVLFAQLYAVIGS
jgi:hypothetical protein